MNPNKPWFWPDTQGFLSVAIILLMAMIILILMFHPVQLNDTTTGVLMTVIGVLTGALKDVYSFFFGSSKGSVAKDDTINTIATAQAPAVAAAAIAAQQNGDLPHASVTH